MKMSESWSSYTRYCNFKSKDSNDNLIEIEHDQEDKSFDSKNNERS